MEADLSCAKGKRFLGSTLKNATKKHKDVRVGIHCAPNVPHIFQYILAPEVTNTLMP